MKQFMTRRDFLTSSAGAAAAAGAITYFPWSQKAFAHDAKNDRLTIGCIGVGGMGTYDGYLHSAFGDIVAVCDVDSRHAERAKNDPNLGKGKQK